MNVHIEIEIQHTAPRWGPFWSCNATTALLPVIYEHAARKEREAGDEPANFTPLRLTITAGHRADDETFADAHELAEALDAGW